MGDIRIVQSFADASPSLDWWLRGNGGLDDSDAIGTAMVVALLTDGRADAADELPGLDDDDRRGWWGDTDAVAIHGGWPIGSRLWLLARSAIRSAGYRRGATLALVEQYAHEALYPLVEIGLGSSVTVSATRSGLNRIDLAATLYRDGRRPISLRFADLWA